MDEPRGNPPPEPPELPEQPEGLPEIDFTTFILSLSETTAIQLGLVPDREAKVCGEPCLAMARQSIDILGMLQEKTRGNLSGAEERLLADILYNLRMAYVRASTAQR